MGARVRRIDLPQSAKKHKEFATHLYAVIFRLAQKEHLRSHREMRSWRECSDSEVNARQLLDCTWVMIYKFDKHRYLLQAKARLVVRRHQQDTVFENTYASTLAGRSFRSLMAIAAHFDLEFSQYDVVNAFVHADLPYEIYMRQSPGYQTFATILQLRSALYGLKELPLLWQQDFTKTFTPPGFKPALHESCCYVKDEVLTFFYVHDIVVARRTDQIDKVRLELDGLKETHSLTVGDDLQWFLGVEILCDRSRRLLWLSQTGYIAKLVHSLKTRLGSPKIIR